MEITDVLIGLLAGVIVGGAAAWFALNAVFNKKKISILEEAEKEGEAIKKEKMLQAKEKFYQLKEDHEKVIKDRNRKIQSEEDRIKQREAVLSKNREHRKKEGEKVSAIKENLERQIEVIETKQKELEKSHSQNVERLEKISNMSASDAKAELTMALKDEARTEAMSHIKEIIDEAKLTAGAEAKKVIIQSIQR